MDLRHSVFLISCNFLSELANVRVCKKIFKVSDNLRTLVITDSNDALGGGAVWLCADGVSVGLHPAPVHGRPAQPKEVRNSPRPRRAPGPQGAGGADIEVGG
jgi:hypothetical protein